MSSRRTIYAEVITIGMAVAACLGYLLGWIAGQDGATGAAIAGVFALPICSLIGWILTRPASPTDASARSTGRTAWLAIAVLVAVGTVVIVVVTRQPTGSDPQAGGGPPTTSRPPTPYPPTTAGPTPTPSTPKPTTASPTPVVSISVGWPVSANDGSTAMWAYFGSEFFFPDWVSCEETYCLAAEPPKIHLYTVRPIKRMRTFDQGTADPYKTLLDQRFTPEQARSLLKI
jgi:hypothetical protein